MIRALAVVSVLAPLVVGGAAFVLLAKALAGSWLWGFVAVGAFSVVYALAVVLMTRWVKRNPGATEGFVAAYGRAMAFGSGGWEPSRKHESRSEE